MKFAVTTTLLATFATTSFTASIPSTTVEKPLPAKFTLKLTSTHGTALDKYPSQITVDAHYGQFLNIGPGSNQEQKPVTFFAGGNTGAYVENTDGLPDWFLVVAGGGLAQLTWPDVYSPVIPKARLALVGNALAFDASDGKGFQALWKACPDRFFRELWEVYWDPVSTREGCIPIGLGVLAL